MIPSTADWPKVVLSANVILLTTGSMRARLGHHKSRHTSTWLHPEVSKLRQQSQRGLSDHVLHMRGMRCQSIFFLRDKHWSTSPWLTKVQWTHRKRAAAAGSRGLSESNPAATSTSWSVAICPGPLSVFSLLESMGEGRKYGRDAYHHYKAMRVTSAYYELPRTSTNLGCLDQHTSHKRQIHLAQNAFQRRSVGRILIGISGYLRCSDHSVAVFRLILISHGREITSKQNISSAQPLSITTFELRSFEATFFSTPGSPFPICASGTRKRTPLAVHT